MSLTWRTWRPCVEIADHAAIGLQYGDEMRWVWIGTHAEYDHELRKYQ